MVRAAPGRADLDGACGSSVTTLWRVESDAAGEGRRPTFDPACWAHQGLLASGAWDAMGRWFTDRRELLAWYAADVGPRFRVVAVSVDPRDAERWRVSSQEVARRFSKDPENEFFLPREVADLALRDGALEQALRDGAMPEAALPTI